MYSRFRLLTHHHISRDPKDCITSSRMQCNQVIKEIINNQMALETRSLRPCAMERMVIMRYSTGCPSSRWNL